MFYTVVAKMIMLASLMGVGYFLRKKEMISEKATGDISSIMLKVTVPCLVLMSMQREFSSEDLYDTLLIVFVGLGIHIICFLLASLLLKKSKIAKGTKQVLIFSTTFSNLAFMGFPVVREIFGETGIFYAAMMNLSFNLLVYSLGVGIMSSNTGGLKSSLKKIINPGIVFSIIGIIFFVFSVKIPPVLGSFLGGVGEATTPLSMLVIGALLTNAKVGEVLLDKKIYLISFVRLILTPLVVYFILNPFIANKEILGVIVILCGMPGASLATVMAEQYGADKVYASKVTFFTTVVSVVTIPLLVKFLGL